MRPSRRYFIAWQENEKHFTGRIRLPLVDQSDIVDERSETRSRETSQDVLQH